MNRQCRYKIATQEWLDGKNRYATWVSYATGTFLAFSVQDDGDGVYPIAIIEDALGCLMTAYVGDVFFGDVP